jgi:hypothetical protein
MNRIFKLNFGDKVKDKVTGATGVIVIKTQRLSGNVRYNVQPCELKEGSPVSSFDIDEDALEVIAPATDPRPDRPFKFNIGDEVKDKWSDLKGVIMAREDHQYGCIRYGVHPRAIVKGKIAQGYSIDESAVVLVKAAKKKDAPMRTDGAESGAMPGRKAHAAEAEVRGHGIRR